MKNAEKVVMNGHYVQVASFAGDEKRPNARRSKKAPRPARLDLLGSKNKTIDEYFEEYLESIR